MNTEDKLQQLEDELKALKIAYQQSASEIIVYTASAPYPNDGTTPTEIIFDTVDGTPAIASLRGIKARRVPYSDGAKWIINGEVYGSTMRVYSMQEGTIIIQ